MNKLRHKYYSPDYLTMEELKFDLLVLETALDHTELVGLGNNERCQWYRLRIAWCNAEIARRVMRQNDWRMGKLSDRKLTMAFYGDSIMDIGNADYID